jgi:glutathione S-transferase
MRKRITTALDMIESDVGPNWAMGDDFTMADIAAVPALFYANLAMPFGNARPKTSAYLERLKKRPSVARTLKEAAPVFKEVFGLEI